MMGEPGRRWKESERVRKIEERKERRGTSGAGISVVEVEGRSDMVDSQGLQEALSKSRKSGEEYE